MLHPQAFELYPIYHPLDQFLSSGIGALCTGIATAVILTLVRFVYHWFTRQETGVFYDTLTDEVINTPKTLERSVPSGSSESSSESNGGTPDQSAKDALWTVSAVDLQSRSAKRDPEDIDRGSQAVIEVKNKTKKPVAEKQFDSWSGVSSVYRVNFPGRKVVNFKIRENKDYHDEVEYLQSQGSPRISAKGDTLMLPGMKLGKRGRKNNSFKIWVLLKEDAPPDDKGKYDDPVINDPVILPKPKPRRWPLRVAITAAIIFFGAGAAGVTYSLVSQQTTLSSKWCFTGTLKIEGSTAFSPVMNQVASQFMQLCPHATIDLTANGSRQGYQDLAKNTTNVPGIVMYDGACQSDCQSQNGAPNDGWPSDITVTPVGVVIFAVVGNSGDSGLPLRDFSRGLTNADIRGAFATPSTPGAAPGQPYQPTGRTTDSGTRQTFDQLVLNNQINVETTNGVNCSTPSAAAPRTEPRAPKFCLWETTMDLLRYVNDTPDAIGYAEADALPFFPDVRQIPIGGYAATRTNALNGDYTFLATEHLLTENKPTPNEQKFLSFLSSKPMTSKLQGNAFIACSDLSSQLSRDCS